MKFNYVLIFLALVFAIGRAATVTKTTYNSFASGGCNSGDCTSCKGRIQEILWSDGVCRPNPMYPTKQSYKFIKATDGKSYRENLYGYTTESVQFNRLFDTNCTANQLYSQTPSASLDVCSQGIISVWGVSTALFLLYIKVKVYSKLTNKTSNHTYLGCFLLLLSNIWRMASKK